MRRGPTGPCCSRRPFSRGSSRAARRRPAAGQAARRCAARHRRLRNPPGDDAADGGRRGRALRLQPAGARRLRGHRADAGRADLRRTAAGVVLPGARGHGLHRSRHRRPGAAVAAARRRGGERGLHVPDGVAHVDQGRPYLGLSRRHRRPAHPVRPVRILHGPHARARRSHPPPQGCGAPVIEGLVGLGIMMLLCALRVPIAFAMAIVGIAGYAYMRDWNWTVAFAMTQTKLYETGRNYTLSVVPLFILMGNFVTRAGMSQQLFRAAYTCIGHLRGGLAMATVCACAGFGAICGSSIATAATMAKVAYPAMSEIGYSDRLSTGAIAGGGTLGILIPPSTIMVIYGFLTETNIGKLFAAGILPGIVATFLLCLAVQWIVWTDPKSGPRGKRSTWRERLVALRGVWAVALLFLVVMGGIYGGIFTATEGAGVGAFGALCFALGRRALTWRTLLDALVESARTTAMLFFILTGALMFAEFVNYTTMPNDLKALVTGFNLSPI